MWTAAKAGRDPQSRLVRYDPATSRISGHNGLGVELAALADDGAVADDTTKPTATVSGSVLHRHVKRGHSYYTGVRVTVDEGGRRFGTLRLGDKIAGFGLVSRYTAGTSSLQIGPSRGDALRKAAAEHRRARVHLTVRDWAGNKRIYDRTPAAVALATTGMDRVAWPGRGSPGPATVRRAPRLPGAGPQNST